MTMASSDWATRLAMRHPWAPYGLLTLAMLSYGSYYVVGRAVHDEFPPVALSFWRAVGACVLLYPFIAPALARSYRQLFRHWSLIAALGLTQAAIGQVTILWALHTTTAINAALISALLPAFTVVLAAVMVRERMNASQRLGIAVAFVGAVIAIVRGDWSVLISLEFVVGDILVLITTVAWAFYSVLVKRVPVNLDPFVVFFGLTAFAAVLLLPLHAVEAIVLGAYPVPSTAAVAGILYIIVFTAILGLVFLNIGIAALGPARASSFYYLMPVFTALIAVVALDEALRLYHLAGLALVVGGIYFSGRPDRAR
ncbi:MAG: DMT family transporter [Alphaproteobacteria bacterium]|nr:DMT family transporter [Alphaproteobacteria bacterium]